jgi:hypothetical protein
MFSKKRPRAWFVRALLNLAAVSLIYRLARGFQKHAQRQGADKKYKGGR